MCGTHSRQVVGVGAANVTRELVLQRDYACYNCVFETDGVTPKRLRASESPAAPRSPRASHPHRQSAPPAADRIPRPSNVS